MALNLRRKISGIYYGWRMIAVGSAIRILGGGLHLYGFTVFFLPISHELGLSRAATSLVFSLASAMGSGLAIIHCHNTRPNPKNGRPQKRETYLRDLFKFDAIWEVYREMYDWWQKEKRD